MARKRRRAPRKVAGRQHTRNKVYGRKFQTVAKRVLARDGYECRIKGPTCTGRATVADHIVPWQEGGAWLDPQNLRAACTACNTYRAKHPEWQSTDRQRTWADCRWPGEFVNQLSVRNWSQEWFRPSDEEIAEWHRAHGLPPWEPCKRGGGIA